MAMNRKYLFYALVLFAFAMAVVYLANYISAGLDNGDAFVDKWYYAVGGVIYIVAAVAMFMYEKFGWYLYMIALILTIVISLLVNISLETLPLIVMAVFLILFLLDDSVKNEFGVSFSVKVKVKL